jgi:hypothetical protein
MPPYEFVRRRLMRFNELKNRFQRLNVSCPTAKHRDDTTEPIRRHDETVTEPDDDPFPERSPLKLVETVGDYAWEESSIGGRRSRHRKSAVSPESNATR